jgi:hypothetical protein
MNEVWQLWFERIFPVRIERQADVLRIDDRRPSDSFLFSVVITATSLIVSAMIFQPTVAYGIYWPFALFLIPAPIFGVKSLMSPIRATHIFDKHKDHYEFRQRTVLKSQTFEGNVSQIRGVQVERRITGNSADNTSKEVFRAVLLLRQELLFGTPDVVPLRENYPLGSYYETETQIASAITNYLELEIAQLVNP